MGKSGGGGGKSGVSRGFYGKSGVSHGSAGKTRGSHGSVAKSMGSHLSTGKPGGSHSGIGKSGSSLGAMQGKPGAGKGSSFSKGHMNGVKLKDVMAEIKAGWFNPSSSGALQVHRGQKGELWCENNRSLFVARQASVPSVDVKVNSNDFKSRCLGGTTKDKLSDPKFLPTIRGPSP